MKKEAKTGSEACGVVLIANPWPWAAHLGAGEAAQHGAVAGVVCHDETQVRGHLVAAERAGLAAVLVPGKVAAVTLGADRVQLVPFTSSEVDARTRTWAAILSKGEQAYRYASNDVELRRLAMKGEGKLAELHTAWARARKAWSQGAAPVMLEPLIRALALACGMAPRASASREVRAVIDLLGTPWPPAPTAGVEGKPPMRETEFDREIEADDRAGRGGW